MRTIIASVQDVMLSKPVPATPLPRDPSALMDTARKNAAWWRNEFREKRLAFDPETFEWILRDLESAGDVMRPLKGPPHG